MVKSHSLREGIIKLDKKKILYYQSEENLKRERERETQKVHQKRKKAEGKLNIERDTQKEKPYKVKRNIVLMCSALIRRHLFNHLLWFVFQSSYNTLQVRIYVGPVCAASMYCFVHLREHKIYTYIHANPSISLSLKLIYSPDSLALL